MTAKGTSHGLADKGPGDNARCGRESANGGGRFLAAPGKRRGDSVLELRRATPALRQAEREERAGRES